MTEMEQNVYFQLRDSVRDLMTFLDGNTENIKSAINAMATVMPQMRHQVNNLIYVVENLRDTIANIDTASIPNVNELVTLGAKIDEVLRAAIEFLPDEPDTMIDVKRTTLVLSDLPALGESKGDIVDSLNGIIGHLYELKS